MRGRAEILSEIGYILLNSRTRKYLFQECLAGIFASFISAVMKNICFCSFGMFFAVLLFFSCQKDALTLGDALEGEWEVFTYQYNGKERIVRGTNTFSIRFQDYDGAKGQIEWWKRRGNIPIIEAGNYEIVDDGENNLNISWTSNGGAGLGGYSRSAFKTGINHDTLILSGFDLDGNKRFIQAKKQ